MEILESCNQGSDILGKTHSRTTIVSPIIRLNKVWTFLLQSQFMKTLFFSNLYPNPQSPTRGMYNVSVFGAIAKHCAARIVAPLPWWTRQNRPGDWISAPKDASTGIEAVFPSWWTIPRYGVAHNGKAMHLSVRNLVRQLRKEFPFDVILASWAYPDAYAASRLAREFDVPFVTNVLGSDINALAKMPQLRDQICETLNLSHRVISVSHALRETVLELGIAPEKVVVQHNGVDGDKFQLKDRFETRKRLGLPLDKKIILYVGNWVPEKGVDVLTEAIGKLKAKGHEEVCLTLVGSGPLEAKLREIVLHHGLESQVMFCGRKSHTEVPDWMAAADIFCLPSLREGCPNVILESLSCGRPVVASRVGGVPELLDARNGLMTEAGDSGELAATLELALEKVWDDTELRETVAQRSWEEVGKGYYATLESAVSNWRPAR